MSAAGAPAAAPDQACTPEQDSSPELRAAREQVRPAVSLITKLQQGQPVARTSQVASALLAAASAPPPPPSAAAARRAQAVAIWAPAAVSVGPFKGNISLQQSTLEEITTEDVTLDVLGAGVFPGARAGARAGGRAV